MTGFVLDNSVCMAWAFEDETDAYSEAVLAALADSRALVPALWVVEAANVLHQAEKRKRLSRADVRAFTALLCALPLDIQPAPTAEDAAALVDVAREHDLSAYDACYLLLAMRTGCPLATRDDRLRNAAKRAGVALAVK